MAVKYLAIEKGEHGLHFVECKYKLTKIKVAKKLCQNMDPSIRAANKFVDEMDTNRYLKYSEPLCQSVIWRS